jgi:hypothetical protein
MSKIIAVPVATASEAKFSLPEPEVTFAVDGEDIVVTARFKNLDTDVVKKSKQTLFFSRTLNPVPVEVEVENPETGEKVASVLAIDSQGRQSLQFRCGLSAPYIEEKEQKENGAGESAADASGDPEDEEV